MRTPLLILASALLVATPARASEPLDAEHASLQLSAQFSRMRQGVPKGDVVTFARIDKMENETRRLFEENLRRFPDRRIFAVDAAYVAESFETLILPRMAKTTEILGDPELTPERRRARLAELARDDGRRTDAFNDAFYRRNRPAMEEAAGRRTPEAVARWAGPDVTDAQRANFGRSDFLLYSPLIGATMDGAREAFSNQAPTGLSAGGLGASIGDGKKVVDGGKTATPSGQTDVDAARDSTKSGIAAGAAGLKGEPPAFQGASVVPPEPRSWLPALAAVSDGAPRAYSEQAGEALRSGRFDEAARMARTALELDPSDKNARFVLASAKGRASALDASAASRSAGAAAASALKPFAPDPGPGGGVSPAPAAAPAAAASPVPAAAVAVPIRPATRAAIAEVQTALRLGDDAAALALLDSALRKDPESPGLLSLRAQTYGRLGRWEEALRDADKALASMPGNMPLLITKALAENRTGRWREALATSERMIAADPVGAWGYANRAHAWGGLGNREAMLSDIRRAASLDPSFAAAAEQAAALLLPTDADVLFLFPGEKGAPAAAPAPASGGRARDFGLVTGGAAAGGVLLALSLLSLALSRLKESAGSLFTKAAPVELDGPAAAAPRSAPPGLIRGQYALSRQIGAGGMGMVYEGTDRSLGRRVAIKKMREELRVNARERDRFVIEAKTVASLHHPNIVDIYAIAEEGEDVYLVFEFVEGRTVHDLIQSSGRLGLAEAVSVTRSMGEALTYAHSRGVIHRDMKPSNAMLSSDGVIKVMDFGIARMAKDAATRYSMTNNIVGTPPYMAPEQEQGMVRKESDVYALAVCSYEMLTGKMPFIGIGAGMLMNKINMSYIPPSRAIAGLPEALDEVFVTAFQADPDRRYRAPLEFVTALAAAAGGARSRTA